MNNFDLMGDEDREFRRQLLESTYGGGDFDLESPNNMSDIRFLTMRLQEKTLEVQVLQEELKFYKTPEDPIVTANREAEISLSSRILA